jgi:hypothetical protein
MKRAMKSPMTKSQRMPLHTMHTPPLSYSPSLQAPHSGLILGSSMRPCAPRPGGWAHSFVHGSGAAYLLAARAARAETLGALEADELARVGALAQPVVGQRKDVRAPIAWAEGAQRAVVAELELCRARKACGRTPSAPARGPQGHDAATRTDPLTKMP